MNMRNLQEKFSTVFLVAENNRYLKVTGLECDGRLAKNVQQILRSHPQPQEESLAKLFLKNTLANNCDRLSKGHISVYLDETCFWIGCELGKELAPLNISPLECFSNARIFAANPEKTLKNYDFSSSRLQKYAKSRIKSATKENLYSGKEILKYSQWGLLRHCSQKKFAEALEQKSSLDRSEKSRCLLALYCYKKIYTSQTETGSQKLNEPNKKQWQNIIDRYNQLCSKKQIQAIADIEEIKNLLESCVTALKAYSIIDVLPIYENEIPDDSYEIELETESEEFEKINSVVSQAFLELPLGSQKLLKLWQGLKISQSDIAKILDFEKQYQVSRQISRCQKNLLEAVVKWCQSNMGITPIEEQIGEMKEPMVGCLQKLCQQEFNRFLQDTLLRERGDYIKLLRLHYGEKLKSAVVANKLNISAEKMTMQLEEIQEYLQGKLQQWVVDELEIVLPNSANKKIANFVEDWLINAPYATFSLIPAA